MRTNGERVINWYLRLTPDLRNLRLVIESALESEPFSLYLRLLRREWEIHEVQVLPNGVVRRVFVPVGSNLLNPRHAIHRANVALNRDGLRGLPRVYEHPSLSS